jgi:hypothetical protein
LFDGCQGQALRALCGLDRTQFRFFDIEVSPFSTEEKQQNKTLQRQAYGFRDREFFKLKIYALHEKKYALVG